MNNLYGQQQVLGKAATITKTTENGQYEYVIPYNPSDFFAYSGIDFKDINACKYFDNVNLNNTDIDDKCNADPNADIILRNNKGDAILLQDKYCYSRELCRNKAYADKITSLSHTYATNGGQYLDTVTQANIQLLNITNLSIGIIAMLSLAFSYS